MQTILLLITVRFAADISVRGRKKNDNFNGPRRYKLREYNRKITRYE